jgi:hypothetical protein
MKKIKSLLLIITASAFLISGLTMPAIIKGVFAYNEGFKDYMAPSQSNPAFTSSTIAGNDITNWSPTTNNAITQTLNTSEADFEAFVQSKGLKSPEGADNPDFDYWKVSPTHGNTPQTVVALSQKTPGVRASANYTASEDITLSADAYYVVSLQYYVLGDEPSHFYLTNTTEENNPKIYELPLTKQFVDDGTSTGNDDRSRSRWQDAYFFIKTDLLKTVKIRPSVYLGGQAQAVNGVAYFYDFTVEVMSETFFNDEFTAAKKGYGQVYETIIDLTVTEGVSAPVFDSAANVGSPAYIDYTTVGSAETKTNAASVVSALNFKDRDFFWGPKSGDTNEEVMLVYADQSYSGIKINQRLKPEPHAAYLITFYTIAGSYELSSNYFRMGDEYNNIALTTYQLHNGWQLNTFFYSADCVSYQPKQDSDGQNEDGYLMGFYVGQEGTVASGWMAISDFKVRKISGDYYSAYSTQGTAVAFVPREDTTNPANANFNKGTSSSYDKIYPLKASSWTAASAEGAEEYTNNGIINTMYTENLDIDGVPGAIGVNNIDNNIYMLSNKAAVYNEVSTTFSATVNATNYISFDAYASNNKSKAVLKYNDAVIAQMPITNTSKWQRYEFNVAEAELTTARTYTFAIVREDIGETYIDNVNFQTAPSAPASGVGKTIQSVDITNPVKINGAWSSSNGTNFTLTQAINGINIMNNGQEYTEIENTYTYTTAAESYYKMTITASGENAHLGATGYEGFVTLISDYNGDEIKDEPNEYNLYFYVSEAGTVALTIKLGTQEIVKDENGSDTEEKKWVSADGQIFIKSLNLIKYEDATAFNAAKKTLEESTEEYPKAAVLSVKEETSTPIESETPSFWDSFGKDWWYLVPTLITAVAIITALIGYLIRNAKFNKHITRKDTSYARDVKIEKARKKILATRAAKQEKIDNSEKSSNNETNDKEEHN